MKSRKIAIIIAITVPVVFAVVASAGVYARFYVVNFHRIPQEGMYPGLPAGSLFFSRRNPYPSPSSVQRGDVVLFTKTMDGELYKIVWRVIGLPGDQIVIDGEKLLINGVAPKRERLRQDGDLVIYRETSGNVSYEVAYPQEADDKDQPKASLTVPKDSFYVLGDNRFNALDSRFDGPISFDSIFGKKIGN